MSQTSIIAAALIVAFIVFITVRGELPGYLGIFTDTAGATGKSGSAAGSAKPTINFNFYPVTPDPTQPGIGSDLRG